MPVEPLVFHCEDRLDIGLWKLIQRGVIVNGFNFRLHLFHTFFRKRLPVASVSLIHQDPSCDQSA